MLFNPVPQKNKFTTKARSSLPSPQKEADVYEKKNLCY